MATDAIFNPPYFSQMGANSRSKNHFIQGCQGHNMHGSDRTNNLRTEFILQCGLTPYAQIKFQLT